VRRATTIFHIQPGYCRHEELHNFHGPAAKWPMPRGKAADDEIQPFLDRIYLRLRISQRVAVASCVGAMFCLLFGLGPVEIQDSQIRKSVIQAPKGVWHAPIRFDRRPVGEDGAALFR
jgi:hypothetical protein